MTAADTPSRRSPERQASDLAVGAVVYQCETLRDQIAQFKASPFAPETQLLAWVLDVVAQAFESRLRHYLETQDKRPLAPSERSQVNLFTRAVQHLYALTRYLHSSDPSARPDCLQAAISDLASRFVQPAGVKADDCLVLVRAQWTQGPVFQDLFQIFEEEDVYNGAFKHYTEATDFRAILSKLWETFHAPGNAPHRVTLVSFSRLDGGDTLLFPLLVHEAAHFIDYSHAPYLSDREVVTPAGWLYAEVVGIRERFPEELSSRGGDSRLLSLEEQVERRAATFLQEMAADQIALRLAGLSYFIAVAEYFKPQYAWPGPVMGEGSYPGFGYRMSKLVDALLAEETDLQIVHTLRVLEEETRDPAFSHVLNYLDAWAEQVAKIQRPDRDPATAKASVLAVLETKVDQAVTRLTPEIRTVIGARESVEHPHEISATLQLIRKALPELKGLPLDQCALRGRQDASLAFGSRPRFQNVMAAGWIYQLAEGEYREEGAPSSEQRPEYQRMCAFLRGILGGCYDRESDVLAHSSAP